jgi:hypothetical protein
MDQGRGPTDGAALARAWRWQEQLESGEFASIQDLADDAGVSRVYAGRMMRLTALAPELVQAILAGDEPDGLSIEKLHDGIPLAWQRKQWLGDA